MNDYIGHVVELEKLDLKVQLYLLYKIAIVIHLI